MTNRLIRPIKDKLPFIKQNKGYVKILGSMYVLMALNYVVTFFLTPYTLHHLGQEQYSLWLLFFSIISYLSLSNLGFGNVFMVELPKMKGVKQDSDILLSTFVFCYGGFTLVAVMAIAFLYTYFDSIFKTSPALIETAQKTLIVFGLIFIIQFFQSLFESILYVNNKLPFKNMLETGKVLANALFTILLIQRGYGVYHLALACLVVYIIGFVVVLSTAKKVMPFHVSFKHFDWTLISKSFGPSWNYFIIMLSSQIIFYSDSWLISSLAGIKFLAAYTLMYRLADVLIKSIFKLADAKNPKILELSAQRKLSDLKRLHWRLQKLNALVAIPSALFLGFFGVYILKAWLGKTLDFDPTIMILFSILLLTHTTGHVSALFVLALGIHKKTSYITILEAGSNLLLSFMFYKIWGIAGIAVGTLVSNLLLSFWFVPYQFLQYVNNELPKHEFN